MLRNKYLIILLLILFILPGIWALLQPGFFLSDDGEWMVIRFSAFYENLVNGQFPVRFLSRLNNGFGYPVADFLYPLFMYIGAPIHYLGASFVDTIKIILGGSLALSGVFAFLWLRKIFGNAASFTGALVYTLFPYHLWDIYKRGSVGEVLALSMVPFILWQVERKSLTLVSLGVGALIVSHNTLALIFLPVIATYMILNTNVKFAFLTFALGLGLSAFFWLPALIDLQYTIFNQTAISNFSDYFINKNFNLLGLVSPAIIILTAAILRKDKNFFFFAFVTLLSVLLALDVSSSLWRFVSPFIQFPFRFLSVVMLGLSFIAAFSLSRLKGRLLNIAVIILLTLLFWSAKDFITPSKVHDYPDSYYSTNQDTTTVKNEYMPRWVKNPTINYDSKVQVVEGAVKIENLTAKPNKITFNSKGEGEIQINTVYFPGWKAYINGNETKIDHEKNGLIVFDVQKNDSKVEVKFGETNLRIFADLISLLSLGLVFGWLRFK
jgi:hypothetical protein